MANELKGTLKASQNIGTNLNPTNIGNFQKVLRDISRQTYEKRAKSDEKSSALAGAGASASEVSGGTFASVMGALEQMRGGDISKEYAAGVEGYKATLAEIEKKRSEAKSSGGDAMTNMKKTLDLIKSYKDAGLEVPKALYAAIGTKDPDALPDLTPEDAMFRQTLAGQMKDGQFIDVNTYLKAKDDYTRSRAGDNLENAGPISQEFDEKFGDMLDPSKAEEFKNKGIDITAQSKKKPQYNQYGLLAQTDFNPQNETDKEAKQYLDYYIKNAAFPTSYQLGMGRTAMSAEKFSSAAQRAQDLYFKATGTSLPDASVLKANKTLINANNKILNNQAVVGDAIVRNFDLAIQGEITNDVNQNATIVNKILNPIYLALGDPAVNQAMVSNGTISQEFANLVSIRNASGTTVADKEMASELIKFGTSVEAQKAVVERLKAEAANIHDAVRTQNEELYKVIDPLETELANPNRQKKLGDYKSSPNQRTNTIITAPDGTEIEIID